MFSQLLLFTSSLNSALGWGVKELRIYDRWYCGRAAGWLLTTFLSGHFQYWRRGKKKKTEHSSLLCSLPELGITLLYETNCMSAGGARWVIWPDHSDQYFWIYFCFSRDNCWLSADIFSVVFLLIRTLINHQRPKSWGYTLHTNESRVLGSYIFYIDGL